MVNNKVWFAKNAVIKLGLAANNTSVGSTASLLDAQFGTATTITGIMKDIQVTEPMGDVDMLNFLGTDSNGFQNAELEEKPAGIVEIQGTMILPGDEVVEDLIYDAATTIASTHSRYRAGKASKRSVCLLLNLDDSTDEVNYAGTNMLVAARGVKVTGADGHFEANVTFKCLPRDWYGPEFKN
jgi:hypothetical protein